LHGVQYVSFTEEHFRPTGPAGELMIAVAAWIAKQERIRISERVRAGLSRAKAEGTRSGNSIGRPKAIFDRQKVAELRNQGRSWREIAKACNAGFTTVRRAYGRSFRLRATRACQNRARRIKQAVKEPPGKASIGAQSRGLSGGTRAVTTLCTDGRHVLDADNTNVLHTLNLDSVLRFPLSTAWTRRSNC
jgi:hypothetical protein